jgi:hypothetical protein
MFTQQDVVTTMITLFTLMTTKTTKENRDDTSTTDLCPPSTIASKVMQLTVSVLEHSTLESLNRRIEWEEW